MSDAKSNKMTKWIGFIILTLAAGLIYRVPYLKTVFYDNMVSDFGLTNTQIGLLMTVYSLTKTILYIPGGILADKFDNRKMLLGSTGLLAILTFWYATSPGFAALRVIYFFLAISNVLFWVSFVKAVRLFGSEDEQGSVFGYSEGIRAVAGLIINFAALGILGVYISSTCPLRYVLIFYGIVYVIMGVFMFFLLPHDDKKENVATSVKDYINVLKVPSVWLVAILVLCAYSVQVAAEYTTTYLTTVFGMSAVVAGIVATIRSYGIGIFSAPIIGKVSDKVGSYTKTLIGLFVIEIIFGIALIAIPGKPNFLILAIVVVLALATVYYAVRGVYYATMGEAGVPVAMTGTATGIISVIGYLPDSYENTILGNFLDKYAAGGFNYVFGTIVVFALLGIGVCFIIRFGGKRKKAQTEK